MHHKKEKQNIVLEDMLRLEKYLQEVKKVRISSADKHNKKLDKMLAPIVYCYILVFGVLIAECIYRNNYDLLLNLMHPAAIIVGIIIFAKFVIN